MARRSILSPVRDEQHASSEPVAHTETTARTAPAETVRVHTAASASSRHAKLHVGGYLTRAIPSSFRFKSSSSSPAIQQDMLLEALWDFVAKQEAARAFR